MLLARHHPRGSAGHRCGRAEDLLAERTTARTRKDFAASDQLRAEFAKLSVAVADTPEGQSWSLAREPAGTALGPRRIAGVPWAHRAPPDVPTSRLSFGSLLAVLNEPIRDRIARGQPDTLAVAQLFERARQMDRPPGLADQERVKSDPSTRA